MMNWSYAAGFIDGDGTIGFFKEYGNPRPSVLATQMNNRVVLEELRDLFGLGSISQRPNGLYAWRSTGFKLREPLIALEPFLIIKKANAQRLIKLIECRTSTNHQGKICANCDNLVEENRHVWSDRPMGN